MKGKRYWEIGGFIAGAVLIVFGAVALYMGVNARNTVSDELNQQYIVGSADMTPSGIKTAAQEAGLSSSISLPTCNVAGKAINTGSEARCFAQYMRIHTLESTNGLSYAQMGRFQSAKDPSNPAGTNDQNAAAKDAQGNPVSNSARNIWINETALTTALNVSYMASQLALFGIVVGIALLLSGVGFLILAFVVFGRIVPEEKKTLKTVTTTPHPAS
jgi:hypothetical protein